MMYGIPCVLELKFTSCESYISNNLFYPSLLYVHVHHTSFIFSFVYVHRTPYSFSYVLVHAPSTLHLFFCTPAHCTVHLFPSILYMSTIYTLFLLFFTCPLCPPYTLFLLLCTCPCTVHFTSFLLYMSMHTAQYTFILLFCTCLQFTPYFFSSSHVHSVHRTPYSNSQLCTCPCTEHLISFLLYTSMHGTPYFFSSFHVHSVHRTP